MNSWDDLSIREKAEMMKVAIRNGIISLPDIKNAYNEFAEGGNLFKKGGPKKKPPINSSAQRAMRYFMDKGLTDYQAAGLVGNLMRESGMDPEAVNSSSKAYGLAQWLGSRKKALFAKYGNHPTLDNQLDFIWSELNSTHRNGLKHIKASKSAEEAARNAMGYYEFSVGPAGAIANMKKYGQDGEGSMAKGITFASRLMGQPVPTSYSFSDSPQLPVAETVPQEDFSFTPMNPQVFGMQMPSYQSPVVVPEQPIIVMAEQPTPTPEQIERQRIMQEREEQRDALNRFGLLMSMSNPQQGNDMMGAIGMLAGLGDNGTVTAYSGDGNYYYTGGPKRRPMPAHPKTRDKDPKAWDDYQQYKAERALRRQQQEKERLEYVEELRERDKRNAEKFSRDKDIVMSALSDSANSVPFTGDQLVEAAEAQRQEKLDKLHELKLGLDATMTAAELSAAGYGVVRGLTHFNRMLARQATQSTGQAVSREAMQNLLKWNKRVATIDKPQVMMDGIGGTADAYQWYTADNSFDAWENGLETGANSAGVVGGINWFKNLPYLRRIGGDKIDAVLDGIGYGAASWDLLKYMPPLSTYLDKGREVPRNNTQDSNEQAYGGSIYIKPSHRGRFTELKERTGHSASWFKEHGTPAQKKMAIFELNSRHWNNHALGGYLEGAIYDLPEEEIQRLINSGYEIEYL